MNKKPLWLFGIAAISASATTSVHAHGWVEFPNARQSVCYEDGGFWSDAIPNKACQSAYDISGAFPFVQRNEIAANVPKYGSETEFANTHVQSTVSDGNLCSAGDGAKAGLDVGSPFWHRTRIELDANNQIDYVFYGSTPHNPSFWQFYLTKPEYDTSLPLNWSDLELIDTAGNVTVDADKRYRIKVTFPAGRTGDAILYTRWQREDVAGEGFYNCSDIRFVSGDPNDPGNNLTPLGYYVPQGFGPVESGDTVRFRTFDANGTEQVDLNLSIQANNTQTWQAELAGQFNGLNQQGWYIGIWHAAMNHYMFDVNNLASNKVFAPNGTFNYALSLIKGGTPVPPAWSASKAYSRGEKVRHNNINWEANWWTQSEEPGVSQAWKKI